MNPFHVPCFGKRLGAANALCPELPEHCFSTLHGFAKKLICGRCRSVEADYCPPITENFNNMARNHLVPRQMLSYTLKQVLERRSGLHIYL